MAPTTRRWNVLAAYPDALVGVGLVAICGVLFWLTRGFPEVPAMLSQNVPPTFFPRLVLGCITLLSMGLIAKGLTKTHRAKERIGPTVFLTAGIITLSVLLVRPLGMLLTVALLAILMPLSWGERRFHRIAILAVVLPLAIHAIFTLALGIRFPLGVLAALFS